jgi:hypothetical protein
MWMELKVITLSEISQTEYHMFSFTYGSQKININLNGWQWLSQAAKLGEKVRIDKGRLDLISEWCMLHIVISLRSALICTIIHIKQNFKKGEKEFERRECHFNQRIMKWMNLYIQQWIGNLCVTRHKLSRCFEIMVKLTHRSNARNVSYSYPYLKVAKPLCLSYYCYVFSSTKLENRVEQVLPYQGGRGRGRGWGIRRRDGSNNVCTYE